ncbi:MAG: Rad51 [Thermoplasmata archaeon]|nr:Rad51 [Thermoplasmata archaeon]
MWEPLLEPGRLALFGAPQRLAVGFLQELTHFAVHRHPGAVLWCDGAHSFHPDVFAELNLTRGHAADDGADRVLVKRCMTPFQWDSTLTQHLGQKLEEADVSLVVVNPFDTLWTHEEISDWEQEDYTRFSVKHLLGVARRHRVPILLGVDIDRWWATHPVLAKATVEAVDARWTVTAPDGRWRAVRDDGLELDPYLRRQVTLLDFVADPAERVAVPVPPRHSRRKAKAEEAAPGRPFRTRIVHPQR